MVVGAHGRSPKDLVYAVRALLWLQLVHNLSPGLSDLDLDALFARQINSPHSRAFSLIGRHGIDPGDMTKRSLPLAGDDKSQRSVSLMEKVGATTKYRPTQVLYDATLWRFLMPTQPTMVELGRTVLKLAKERDFSLTLKGPLNRHTARAFEAHIGTLSSSTHVDDLGLLIALHLLLVRSHARGWANIVGLALPDAACRFAKSLECDDITTAMFVALVRDRAVLGHRLSLVKNHQWIHAQKGLAYELGLAGRTPNVIPRLAAKSFALLAVSRYKKIELPTIGPFIAPTVINKRAGIVLGVFGQHDPEIRFDLGNDDPLLSALRARFISKYGSHKTSLGLK